MVAPFPVILQQVITTPNSAIISWMVPSIAFDQENYTVQYGTEIAMLSTTSRVVQGNDNLFALNDLFSINITGLTPFTRYYYTIVAINSINSTSTMVMNFTTDETGVSVYQCANCS